MKIGIVNDSDMATQAIATTLNSSPEHLVLWTAQNGPDAIQRCSENTPDLVLMDLVMPGMNGVETTRAIMRSCPTAILVVTASVRLNCALAFQAMGAGALDVIATPTLASNDGRSAFLLKIAQLAVIIADPQPPAVLTPSHSNKTERATNCTNNTLVAIGCSAGGPAALAEILRVLNPVKHAALVIIQHIDARFIDDLAGWLKGFCKDPLQLVAEGDLIEPGRIYLAGKHGHLETQARSSLHYNPNLGGRAYQPSVDVFFASIARTWRGRALGAVLTGMGRDGASGLHAMRDAGFLTIAQDENSSALFGMPKAAAPFASEILPLSSIAPRINQWIHSDPTTRP